MNARLFLVLLVLGGALTLTHCAGNQPEITRSSTDKEQLASYRTYAWTSDRVVDVGDSGSDADVVGRRIVAGMNRGLQDRGWTRISPAQADLLVSYEADASAPPKPDWRTEGREAAGESPLPPNLEGALSFEMRDRKTGRPVYRGSADPTLLDDPSEWKSETAILSAVTTMLKDLPRL